MHSVGADHQVVVLRVLLPGQAPVGGDSADVEGQGRRGRGGKLPGVWLRSPNVRRTINGPGEIQMIVPHGVPADSSDVFPQCSIDDGAGVWRGRPITAHPWKA